MDWLSITLAFLHGKDPSHRTHQRVEGPPELGSIERPADQPRDRVQGEGSLPVLSLHHAGQIAVFWFVKRQLNVDVRRPSSVFVFLTHGGQHLACTEGVPRGPVGDAVPTEVPVQHPEFSGRLGEGTPTVMGKRTACLVMSVGPYEPSSSLTVTQETAPGAKA